MKRIHWLLTLCVTLLLLCAAASAETYPAIQPNTATQVDIELEGEVAIFGFKPTQKGYYSFYSTSEDCDPVGYLLDSQMELITQNDNYNYFPDFRIDCILEANTQYYFAVKFWDEKQSGSFNVQLDYFGVLRALPEAETVYAEQNNTGTMKVKAYSPMGGLSYQWYLLSGDTPQAIAGATAASYTFPALTESREYQCVVTDAAGASETVHFNAFVNTHLNVFSEQGSEITVPSGSSLTLTVSASASYGEDALTYQWERTLLSTSTNPNGFYEVLEGESSSTLHVDSVTQNTEYFCRVKDANGDGEGCFINVYVADDLSVSAVGEKRRTLAYGSPTTLEVQATGGVGTLSYVWRVGSADDWNAEIIEDATTAVYSLSAVNRSDIYKCTVYDEIGSFVETIFRIDVRNTFSAEAYNDQTDFVVTPGDSQTLKVDATSTAGGLTYQWYENLPAIYGVPIKGATAAQYTLDNISKQGNYFCRVKDAAGNVEDVFFRVFIDNQFGWTYDETYFSLALGETMTLQVDVSCAQGPLTYRWYVQDQKTWNEFLIEGANTSELTIQGDGIGKYYRCVVSDPFGNRAEFWFQVSHLNHLTVESVTDTSFTVAPGETVRMEVQASCDVGNITYNWYRYDDLRNYYVFVSGGNKPSFTLTANKACQFYCEVSDDYGNREEIWYRINIDNELQVSAVEPTEITALPGDSVTMGVEATCASGTLYYEWFKYSRDGREIALSSETGTSCTIIADASREYYCRVTDDYGNEQTVSFYITTDNQLSAQAAADTDLTVEIGDTFTLEVEATCSVGTLHYQWRTLVKQSSNNYLERVIPNETAASYTAIADKAGRFICLVSDDYGNSTEVWFWVSVDNQLKAWAVTSTNVTVEMGGSVTMEAAGECAVGGLTYQWYQQIKEGQDSYYEEIPNATASSYTAENLTEAKEFYCEVCDEYNNEENVYFYLSLDNGLTLKAAGLSHFYVHSGESVTLEAEASCNEGDLQFAWRSSANYDEWISTNDSASYTVDNVTENVEYQCRVTDAYGNEKSMWFYIELVDDSYEFFADRGCEYLVFAEFDQPATLYVTAYSSRGPLTYQWFVYDRENSDWVEIQGATEATYTTPGIQQATSFYCRVSDGVESSMVQFEVRVDIGLTVWSNNDSIAMIPAGGSDTLRVVVSSKTDTVTYQWEKNGVPIEGATENFFTATESGYYEVYIDDGFGGGTSSSWWRVFGSDGVFQENQSITVNPSENHYFIAAYSFVPAETQTYTFASFGNNDSTAYLFNSSRNRITEDYNSGENDNFMISENLVAGKTYYFVPYVYYLHNPLRIKVTGENYSGKENGGSLLLRAGIQAYLPEYFDGSALVSASSANTAVLTVDDDGLMVPLAAGEAKITAAYGSNLEVEFTATVCQPDNVLKVAGGIEYVEEEAFSGSGIQFVELGSGVEYVAANAFNASNLQQIVVYGSNTYLENGAFGSVHPTILAPAGSNAEEYAQRNNCPFIALTR